MSIFARAIYSGVPLRALAVFLCMCGLFGVVGSVHATTTIDIATTAIYEPTVWTAIESPYLIEGDGFFDVQSDLIIEPGVTVFLSSSTSVFIRDGGSLTTSGTEEAPVIFTGHGDGCTDEERWGGLYFDAPYTVSHITHTEFHCGSMFTGDVGHYEIDWSNPADIDSFYVVWVPNIITRESFIDVSSGDVTIDHTSFYDLTGAALYNTSWYALNAQENWWGDASGPSVGSNPTGTGYAISDNVLYDPWIGQDDVVVPVATSTPTTTARNPVIFIPGIMGTEFYRGNDLIWLDLSESVFSLNVHFMSRLAMDIFGQPIYPDVTFGDVIREKRFPTPFTVAFTYFQNLKEELEAQGYREGVDLFAFPYDWRRSNILTSSLLETKITEVVSSTGAQKVDLIAHSMGGLVVKDYISKHSSSHLLDKVIFLGTPHLGSPNSIKTLLFGDDLSIQIAGISFIDKRVIKEISANMQSVYQLLPSRSYYQNNDSVIYSLSDHRKLNYAETSDFLIRQGGNDLMRVDADIFHQNIDSLNFPDEINTFSIQGCGLPTLKNIIRQSQKNGETEWRLRLGDGDGTVPTVSAASVNISDSHKLSLAKLRHATMPGNFNVDSLVVGILNNSISSFDNYLGLNECGIKGKLVSIHSPVEISVVDSFGNYVGKINDTDTEIGIDGGMYEELDENKFIFIPEPEGLTSTTYTVYLDGTATGTFNMRVTDIDSSVEQGAGQSAEIGTSLFIDVPVNGNSTGSMLVTFHLPQGEVDQPTLTYDQYGSGQTTDLIPDALTSRDDESDLTPPTTTIHFQGIQGTNSWYRSTVTTTLTSLDEGSGSLRTMYSLNHGNTWTVYNTSTPIVFSTDGIHTIEYFSIDRVGNREEPQSLVLSIDTTPPEARFSFSPLIQDVSVIGVDSMSSTTVSTTPNSYAITDQAGNTLQLIFNEINRPLLKRASLNRLVYNGQLVEPNTRLTSFVWLTNTRNEIISLQQALRYNIDEGLYALYTKLGNRTFIRERINWSTFQDRYESGVRIFNFTTNKGVIHYY